MLGFVCFSEMTVGSNGWMPVLAKAERTVEAVNIMLLILLEWIMGKWSEKGYVVKRVTGKKVVDVGVMLKTRYGE